MEGALHGATATTDQDRRLNFMGGYTD
jgi:hypothetical protein